MEANRRGRGGQRGSRGFARGRGTWRGSSAFQQPVFDRPPSPAIGPLIETIKQGSLFSLDAAGKDALVISDCKFMASFNWMDSKEPTVMVPGMPPVWAPLAEPKQLQEDSGEYFRDQNAARFPTYPMEPAVRALLAHETDLAVSEIDIFACGSTLGSLLRFVRKVDKPFRFTVEVIGNTVFFVRRENTPDERLIGVRGYGHAFPESYTKWHGEVKRSASHQRLIRYIFAGLKCIVRFEGDGYLDSLAGEDTNSGVLADMPEVKGLTFQEGGRSIPQEAIFDLKTRSVKRKDVDVLAEELPRLWITQIPNFVLAFQERGIFHKNDTSVRDVRTEVDRWEMQSQRDLRMLEELLHKLLKLVKSTPDGECEVRCREVGVLEVRSQLPDAPPALSPELCHIWTQMKGPSPPKSDDVAAVPGAHPGSSEDESADDGVDLASFSDDGSAGDLTACSAACGYCGRC
ncbi:hypothetical protein B0A55_02774 [Friedmanniomyces simplex]|uniref:Geranylgeranyl pyrophosphate synthetase n=1 Tax=Friedmanniomyces simplex TaxID=329884 RepID=A0A4V5NI12_9PEZI|nr:hypothetical protein B0A55_02774 [Friedmanniomyces simplex]